ncbi:MAG: hypothetical protein AB1610_04140 [Nitrospirota bacterium]
MTSQFHKLKSKILTDPYNFIIFRERKGREVYLVGGYIRDILRGIHSRDRDYVINGDIQPFVDEINEIIKGSIVRFKKGDMLRIVTNDGFTLDFSRLIDSLEKDLSKRDFTINAIAWSPEKGGIDLFKSIKDIKKKKVRSIHKKNLVSDPLRMLRAYRFAAELNGSIETRTRELIKMLHNNIKIVSPERITLEIFNLLNSKQSSKYLKMAFSDNILSEIFHISSNKLSRNIKEISSLENITLSKLPQKFKVMLHKIFSQNLTYKGLLCLELLLQHGSAEELSWHKIKMSTSIRKRIELVHKSIKAKLKLNNKVFDIFKDSKEASFDILILADRLELLKDYMRFKKIWKKGLLSSSEISRLSNLKEGPLLGKLITELKRAQFEGRLKSKKSAVDFIKKYL